MPWPTPSCVRGSSTLGRSFHRASGRRRRRSPRFRRPKSRSGGRSSKRPASRRNGFPRNRNCLTPINAHIYFGAHCRVTFLSNTASFRYAIWCSDSLGCAASFDHPAQRFARKTTISCVSSSAQTRYQRTITDNARDQILESIESHSESITSPR